MANTYPRGTAVKVSTGNSPFTIIGGAPFDPTLVTLSYKDPTGAETKITNNDYLSHDGVGMYSYVIPIVDTPGTWEYKFVGTGNCQVSSGRMYFTVSGDDL